VSVGVRKNESLAEERLLAVFTAWVVANTPNNIPATLEQAFCLVGIEAGLICPS